MTKETPKNPVRKSEDRGKSPKTMTLAPLLHSLLLATEDGALALARRALLDLGYSLQQAPGLWLVAEPPNPVPPVALVAHLDTVWKAPPKALATDGTYVFNANHKQGCGADDRCGVYAVLEAAKRAPAGFKPLVILTHGEEVGGIGVGALVQAEALTPYLEALALFLEPDRKGATEFVYYSHMLPEPVRDLAEGLGLVEGMGSYSDVATITEATRVPHLNLSVGYYDQHTIRECFNPLEVEACISTILAMLLTPPARELVPEEEWTWGSWGESEELSLRSIYDTIDQLMNDIGKLPKLERLDAIDYAREWLDWL